MHKLAESVCLCVLLGSTSQCILTFFSQNLDNYCVFSMISLQFSMVNIFLSFRRYIQFHSNSSEIWERKKERKRERVCFERLESHKFIGIFWCDFDLVSQRVCFLGNLRDEFWKSLYFRLHYTMQHGMGILSVCGHFWVEELMWLPKMWDERERWKLESVWVN